MYSGLQEKFVLLKLAKDPLQQETYLGYLQQIAMFAFINTVITLA